MKYNTAKYFKGMRYLENPFESGHIKNYLLLYASIVVIMVLFFIASTLFHDVEDIDKKIFSIEVSKVTDSKTDEEKQESKPKFELLDKAY